MVLVSDTARRLFRVYLEFHNSAVHLDSHDGCNGTGICDTRHHILSMYLVVFAFVTLRDSLKATALAS